jgi:hypothetical protein
VRRAALFVVSGALTVWTVAGCGKSEPTKATYVAHANAVCVAQKQSLKRLAETYRSRNQLIGETFRIREHANAQLRAIPIPPKEKVPTEWLQVRETATANAKKIFTTKPGSRERAAAGQAFNAAQAQAVKIALSYALNDCVGFASN